MSPEDEERRPLVHRDRNEEDEEEEEEKEEEDEEKRHSTSAKYTTADVEMPNTKSSSFVYTVATAQQRKQPKRIKLEVLKKKGVYAILIGQ